MSYNTILATAPLTTTNFILKATGTTIGNSLIFDNGTNVGIGTSSPAYTLDVLSTNQYTARFNSSAAQGGFAAWANSGTAYGYIGNAYHIVVGGAVGDMAMAATANMVFSTSGTLNERMRITSAGNVGIGTTAPPFKLSIAQDLTMDSDVTSAQFMIGGATTLGKRLIMGYDTNGEGFGFIKCANQGVAWTSLALQPSGGNVTIGATTDVGGKLQVVSGNTGESTAHLQLRNTNYTGFHWLDGTAYWIGQNSDFRQLRVYSGSNIYTGVYLAAGGSSWTGYSDERIKTDLIPIDNAINKVNQLRAVTGRYKTDDEGKSRSFLIAQDVLKVLPEAVNINNDEMKTLGVQYTDIIPLLVAAIKEQQALITSLQSQINAIVATK